MIWKHSTEEEATSLDRDPAGVKKCQNLDLLFDNNFDIQIKNLASENEGKCQQDKFDRPPPVNSI